MPGEFPRSPWLLKGALVAYDQPILGPLPNKIVFQYNPEQLTRTLQPRLAHQPLKGTAAARNDAVGALDRDEAVQARKTELGDRLIGPRQLQLGRKPGLSRWSSRPRRTACLRSATSSLR